MHPLLIFLLILSALIFVHELGHFLIAKKFGIKVEEFGFGYPPKVWAKKIGETIYSINLLPFGGFVRLYGEDYLEEGRDHAQAMVDKPKYVRALVAVAGVVGNFILGIVLFSIVYSFLGIPSPVDYVKVDVVAAGSPAEAAGIIPGARILEVNGEKISSTEAFIKIIDENQGSQVSLTVDQNGRMQQILLTPRQNPPEGEGAVGVAISSIDFKFYPLWQMPFRGVYYGVQEALAWGILIVSGLVTTVSQLIAGVAPEVAGPIGIYQITSDVSKQGWLLTLQFAAILSINLGILNLLPFPALDGGRLLFIGIETFIGKRVKPKIEQYVHMVGFALLITLMLLITFNDLKRLFADNMTVANFFQSIFKK